MVKINSYNFTKQIKKYMDVKIITESISNSKKQLDKKEQESNKKEEIKKIEKRAVCKDKEDTLHKAKIEKLPLREAIILSEIIGEPKCKSRCRRRGAR